MTVGQALVGVWIILVSLMMGFSVAIPAVIVGILGLLAGVFVVVGK